MNLVVGSQRVACRRGAVLYQVKYGCVVSNSAAQLPVVKPIMIALIHATTEENTIDHTMTRYTYQQESEDDNSTVLTGASLAGCFISSTKCITLSVPYSP